MNPTRATKPQSTLPPFRFDPYTLSTDAIFTPATTPSIELIHLVTTSTLAALRLRVPTLVGPQAPRAASRAYNLRVGAIRGLWLGKEGSR
jgi:hypothetical protein